MTIIKHDLQLFFRSIAALLMRIRHHPTRAQHFLTAYCALKNAITFLP